MTDNNNNNDNTDNGKTSAEYLPLITQKLKEIKNGGKSDKVFEKTVHATALALSKEKKSEELAGLLEDLKPYFAIIPKVRTTKVIKHLLKCLDSIQGPKDIELKAVEETMKWAEENNRKILKQILDTQLASLFFENKQYKEALDRLTKILRQVKRLDDKQLQVEIQLLESRVQHALHNTSKARAALTAARTAANSIYCPPLTQAQIDMQAGILHAEEKDYKTAYSYFYESFEAYSLLEEDELALKALKYMLLVKIMTNNYDDIPQILTNKLTLRYAGRSVDAMKAIADANKNRSLSSFKKVQKEYSDQIEHDSVVNAHLEDLYNNLLEKNLLRIIEPYSSIRISKVATLIDLEEQAVEKKLSQMILDSAFYGVIDAAEGCLHIWEAAEDEELFTSALETLDEMNNVVTSLFSNARNMLY